MSDLKHEHDREGQLIELLVDSFPSLYASNSTFYHSINNLARTLPAMVAGIAGWSEAEQVLMDKEIAAIKAADVSLMPDEEAALQKALDKLEGDNDE